MFIENTSDPIFFVFPADSYNPQLLYYSHIPAMIVSLLVGILVFTKARKSLAGKNLVIFLSLFIAWCMMNLISWSYQYSEVIFIWSFFEPLMIGMVIFAVFFFYSFIHDEYPSWPVVAILSSLFIVGTVWSVSEKSTAAIEVFSANTIQSKHYLLYCYGMSLIIPLLVPYYFYSSKIRLKPEAKRAALIISIGLEFFIFTFVGLSAISTYLAYIGWDELYTLELYGLFPMLVFLGMLIFCMVKFGLFGIKMQETRFVIVILILLVGAQMLFLKDRGDKAFVAGTLIIVAGLGSMLIKMIKTEEKRKREALERANAQLQSLDKAKTEFINLASHQLKTPLTIIKGVASIMVNGHIDKFSPEDKQQFYQSVWNKSLKLENIINGILDAAALSRKKPDIMNQEPVNINIRQLIDKIVIDFEQQINERGIEVVVKFDKYGCLFVYGQQEYIEEALINIISNAIKYTPSIKRDKESREIRNEKGRIEINISNSKDQANVVIQIKDNGIGIAKKELLNLFTRFYRAENAKRMYTDGTGLGLYIAREIVEGHGGKVWVESELNKGTKIYISLPVSPSLKPDIRKYIIGQCSPEV